MDEYEQRFIVEDYHPKGWGNNRTREYLSRLCLVQSDSEIVPSKVKKRRSIVS
jgi:hypothetical protein